MRRGLDLLAPVALLLFLLAAWEAACRLLAVPVYFLPPPSAVVMALIRNGPLLAASAWATFRMALQALMIAGMVAAALALAGVFGQVANLGVIDELAGVEHAELAGLTLQGRTLGHGRLQAWQDDGRANRSSRAKKKASPGRVSPVTIVRVTATRPPPGSEGEGAPGGNARRRTERRTRVLLAGRRTGLARLLIRRPFGYRIA